MTGLARIAAIEAWLASWEGRALLAMQAQAREEARTYQKRVRASKPPREKRPMCMLKKGIK